MKPRLFIDMDGVVVDLHKKVLDFLKYDEEQVMARWVPGSYEISKAIGMDGDYLWNQLVASQGPEWWTSAPPYPWARELYDRCCSIGETFFLTSPINAPSCCAGKLEWLYNFTGNRKFRNFIMTSAKYNCARFNHILIDDKESNCEQFEAEGGKTILFPRHWNSLHRLHAEAIEYTYGRLNYLVEAIENHKPEREALP